MYSSPSCVLSFPVFGLSAVGVCEQQKAVLSGYGAYSTVMYVWIEHFSLSLPLGLRVRCGGLRQVPGALYNASVLVCPVAHHRENENVREYVPGLGRSFVGTSGRCLLGWYFLRLPCIGTPIYCCNRPTGDS